jgi:hypothetical protein
MLMIPFETAFTVRAITPLGPSLRRKQAIWDVREPLQVHKTQNLQEQRTDCLVDEARRPRAVGLFHFSSSLSFFP